MEQKESLKRFRDKIDRGVYSFEHVTCPCGNGDGKLVAQLDRYALSVNTYLCSSCGIMWTSPRMLEGSLARFYEEDYRHIYVGPVKTVDDCFIEQAKHGEAIYRFVLSSISLKHGSTIVDLGCGTGGTLRPFSDAGFSVTGCDIGREFLRRGIYEGFDLQNTNIHSFQIERPASLVILSHVLEHLSDPLSSLERISQLLADEGYIYIEVPGIFSIHETYGDTLKFLQNAHLYHFTLSTLNTMTAKAGFKLIKGDARIRALFQKGCDSKPILPSDQYTQILAYLYFVELRRIWHHPIRMVRRAFRRIFTRI